MVTSIPVALMSSFGAKFSVPQTFIAQANLWVDSKVQSGQYSQYLKDKMIWICVLDRADPTKPAIFNQVLTSNTDVPPALASVLNPDHILIAVICGQQNFFPQGDLFKALIKSGAGAHLKKLERMATYNACGMGLLSRYVLVSVPGTGIGGIETSDYVKGAVVFQPTEAITGDVNAGEIMMLDFVPGPQGYTPVLIG